MQGSVRALKAAPKLHSSNSTRNKSSDTQKYTHIKTYTHPKLTEDVVVLRLAVFTVGILLLCTILCFYSLFIMFNCEIMNK